LLTIINDILDFSKIEAGKLTIVPVVFDLHETMQEIARLFAAEAQKKGIALQVKPMPDTPRRVRSDPLRLRQILTNLIGNALKFTPAGLIDVTVTCTARRATEAQLRFSITDTGIGIPAERLPDLFEKFTQGDASTTRQYGGTGLGLAISKHLVALLGGTIGVSSQSGVGSTFWFTLPVAVVLEAEMASQAALAAPEVQTGDREPPAHAAPFRTHILLAEDKPINQQVAMNMLEELGYRVDVVANGREALAALDQTHYDCLCIDCQMPDIDGYATTAAIRAREAQSGGHLPILAMTAHAMQGDRERCLAAGMDAYLAKPFTMAELSAALETLLPQTDRPVASAAPHSQP
jgi:CheY-like chemotaxis protein